ncbi:MAG TPA: DNA-binding transcriptional regulator [Syntrophothermus lipocalidus]|uniref:TrpR like protein, YerC/YecD n=1 Tax=Syntrophothermus lipocalidus (strain DSM 12680 / TGB-C1) TaxID=643648 RepID=D7CL08_SYNLT|nr:YerC/YecD family TrpR-related protein [Syntrophothermus lipocalidus]ADI01393.1 TrpR like protein, YerC/YecD [Syntrophothermus lipocalidus DSM 12680]HHV77432.1 DNA-binding transcriptional regulator [Syntrophothermus lipocalidus]HOV42953.1 YerC/YecD family TrpR-related protein [Syntrophothermus lipocalidus]
MYEPNWRDDQTDQLVKALVALKNEDEGYRLLDDLCTVSEIKAMAQRLQVARMLKEHHTYNGIAEQTGASTATISRVKRYLYYGANGYQLILQRLKEQND